MGATKPFPISTYLSAVIPPTFFGGADGVEKIGGEALPTTSNGIFTQGVVSRKQAMISSENVRFFLQDLNSSHGTKVKSMKRGCTLSPSNSEMVTLVVGARMFSSNQ